MTLLSLIAVLVVFGLILYLVNLLPIDGTIKKVIYVVTLLVLILWFLGGLGVLNIRLN